METSATVNYIYKENNIRGWRNTVAEQRLQIELILEDSPSLRNVLNEIFDGCYIKARQYILKRYPLFTIIRGKREHNDRRAYFDYAQ